MEHPLPENRPSEGVLPEDHPCRGCGGCCRHIAIEIDAPKDPEDYDNIYWYLLHENIRISIDNEGDWLIEFLTRCRNLSDDLRCLDYERRPAICEEYDHRSCVKNDPDNGEERAFEDAEQFLRYLEEKGVTHDPRAEAQRRKSVGTEDSAKQG